MTGRLTVGSDGRVHGDANLTYNTPWPVPNGSWGSGAMSGAVMHTMVGTLASANEVFNRPGFSASAHFGISESGEIHQWGPIGKGWVAWHAAAANQAWYGVEHADGGNPNNPLTDAQLTASAQVVECLSAFAGFPLQVSDNVNVKGYGTHFMGGTAWSPDGHTCPDLPPHHVRSSQRPEIIRRALAIRAGGAPVEGLVTDYTATGTESLAAIAIARKTGPSTILRRCAIHDGVYSHDMAAWLDAVFAGTVPVTAPVPKGIVLRVPG